MRRKIQAPTKASPTGKPNVAFANQSNVPPLTQFSSPPELTTRLDSIQRVLGCLYVIEGATLGGQVITRHLEKNLGITPESGGAFFAGYGAETGARWKEFCALLTAAAERVSGEDEIVASANDTFATLGRWLFPDTSLFTKTAS